METPLQITFKNTASSEFVEALIRDRVARLERFHHRIIACRVVIEVPHRSPHSGKTALGITVDVQIPEHVLVAKDEEDAHESKGDRTAVINRCFDAMERQLESHAQIRSGQVKRHEAESETGRIVRLFPERGYGFVEVKGSPDLYFSRDAADGDFETLKPGMLVRVTRATTDEPMGPQASSVRRLGDEARG